MAALLLEVLGVSHDDIVADYALTDHALPSILARLAQDPVHAAAMSQIPDSRRMVRPSVRRLKIVAIKLMPVPMVPTPMPSSASAQ